MMKLGLLKNVGTYLSVQVLILSVFSILGTDARAACETCDDNVPPVGTEVPCVCWTKNAAATGNKFGFTEYSTNQPVKYFLRRVTTDEADGFSKSFNEFGSLQYGERHNGERLAIGGTVRFAGSATGGPQAQVFYRLGDFGTPYITTVGKTAAAAANQQIIVDYWGQASVSYVFQPEGMGEQVDVYDLYTADLTTTGSVAYIIGLTGPYVTSPTSRYYQTSGASFARRYNELSEEFTDEMLDQRVKAMLAAQNAGAYVSTPLSAARDLSTNRTSLYLKKAKYYFTFPSQAGVRYRVDWNETMVMEDGTLMPPRRRSLLVDGAPDETTTPEQESLPEVDGEMFISAAVATVVGHGLRPSAGGCDFGECAKSNGGGLAGAGYAKLGSVDFAIKLGWGKFGLPSGELAIRESIAGATLATPKALKLVSAGDDVDAVADINGVLQQVKSTQCLANIVTSNAWKYIVQFYAVADVGTKTNGVYPVTGSPFVIWTIENPAAAPDNFNKLKITESRGSKHIISDYTWMPETSTWELVSGNGLRRETVHSEKVVAGATTYRVETRELRNGGDRKLVAKTIRKLELGVWGERVVEVRSDPDGANLTSTYEYDGDTDRVEQVVGFDGSWVKYEYDSLYRITKKVEPYLNSLVTSSDASNRVTTFTYTTNVISGAGDIGVRQSFTPRRVRQTIPGPGGTSLVTALQWNVVLTNEVHNIVYTGGTESYTNAANLVSIKTERPPGDFEGYPYLNIKEDATLAIYDYTRSTNGLYQTNRISSGAPNVDNTTVTKGTIVEEVLNVSGQLVSHTVIDILSGKTISRMVNSNFDEVGRPQLITYLDGTTAVRNYACCGLESETGRDGSVNAYSFDDLKRLKTIYRDGVTLIREYNAADQITAVTRQGTDGSSVVLGSANFDLSGRLASGFDIRGTESSIGYQYSTNGTSTLTLTSAVGTAFEATLIQETARDGASLKKTGTGVRGARYVYEPGGALGGRVLALDAVGADTSEWVESIFDVAGRAVTNRFRLSSSITADSQMIYNGAGQLIKTVAPDGVITLFQYDDEGALEYSAIDMDRDSVIDFDGTDRIVQVLTDTVASHGVDVMRSRAYIWGAEGVDSKLLVSTREVSVDGMQAWVTAYGLTSHAQKVHAGNGLCYITNSSPDGAYSVTTLTNGRTLIVSSHDANGVQLRKVTLGYDEHRRLVTQTDERNGTTTLAYSETDEVQRVTTPTPGDGQAAQVTHLYYDALGRVWRTVLPDGSSVTNEFYLTGELKKSSGSRTYPVEYDYDHQGRLKTLKTWQNHVANTGTATTTWNYDAFSGFLTSKRYADAQGVDYSYYNSGAKGRLQTRTWARGVTTTYSYNNAGSVSGIDYSDATTDLSYTYDRRGRVTEVTQGSNVAAMAYNDAGLLLQEAWTGGLLNGLVVTNGFDALLRRQSLQLLQSGTVKAQTAYTYDAASRLSSVSDGTNSATYAYVANSPLVGGVTYARSGTTKLTRTNAYDALNRLTAISFSSVGGFTSAHEYLYDQANQRRKVTLQDGSYWEYNYDELGQVTAGKKYAANGTAMPGQQFGYEFDDIGNRTESSRNSREATYTPNDLNQYTGRTNPGFTDVLGTAETNATVTVNWQRAERLGGYYRKELVVDNSSGPVWLGVTNLSVLNDGANPDIVKGALGNKYVPPASESYSYDGDGNRTNDARWVYLWDAENRLIQMETKTTAVTVGIPREKVEFSYDYRSRRISKKSYSGWNGSTYTSTSEKRFAYDGWNVIAEFTMPSGLLLEKSYVWGLDVSLSLSEAGGVGGLVSMTEFSGNTSHFYSYDGNGNVVGLVDASTGTETARYEYGPFGEVIRSTGLLADVNPYRFSTKYQDDESGLLYYGFRYYEAETGRWLSRDPIGEFGGVNVFGFLGNDAVGTIDFLGLLDPAWAAAANARTCIDCHSRPDVLMGGYMPYDQRWFNPRGENKYSLSADWIKSRESGLIKTPIGIIGMTASGLGEGSTCGLASPVAVPLFLYSSKLYAEGIRNLATGDEISVNQRLIERGADPETLFALDAMAEYQLFLGSPRGQTPKAPPSNVIVDTDMVIQFKTGKDRLLPGETPVKTKTTQIELEMLVRQGRMKMPKVAGDIPTVPDACKLDTTINVRGKMQEIAERTKKKIKGNIVGDGRTGATALDTDTPLLTGDKLLKQAVEELGGETR